MNNKSIERIPLHDICDVFDGPHATPQKRLSGPIYLGIDAITSDGYINASSLTHLSESDYLKWTKRVVPKEGDIVFSYEATLGRYALIPANFYGCLGRRLAIIRKKKSNINTVWLYYYFRSPEWSAFIKSHIVKGSTVDRISIEDFPYYTVPNFPLPVQNSIANVLSGFDKKIVMNKAINNNLMQMASTVYMHYFFKRIPNGKLGNILIEHPKSNIQVGEAQEASGNVPFFTSGDSILKWDNALVDDRCCYLNTGGNADVKFYVGKAAYSTDTWCISGKDQLSDYLFLLLEAIKPELDKKFFQGTGLKHLQKPLLKDRPIYIPTTDELNAFNVQIMPMMTKISENTRENQQLIQLRDWLLPMLMNGQATVAD